MYTLKYKINSLRPITGYDKNIDISIIKLSAFLESALTALYKCKIKVEAINNLTLVIRFGSYTSDKKIYNVATECEQLFARSNKSNIIIRFGRYFNILNFYVSKSYLVDLLPAQDLMMWLFNSGIKPHHFKLCSKFENDISIIFRNKEFETMFKLKFAEYI